MLQVPSKTPALYKRLAQLNHAALFQTGRVLDLNTIMKNAAELTASDFAVLLLTDESRCRVHAAAAVGLNGGAERFSSLVDEGILDRFRNRLNVGPAVQLTATPVLEPAGLAGILIAGKSLYFTEEEIWTMSVLAEFAAVAIRSRRLHDIET